jgi:hypothetical protein
MSKSLWNFYDGEPFMENPHLVVLNPRKKGSNKMAKKSAKARMAHARSFRKGGSKRRKAAPKRKKKLHYSKRVAKNRYLYVQNPRRRYKRNAFPMAGVLANRRRHKRNPSIMGYQIPPIKTVAYAAAGFMGTPMLESFINKYLPTSITSSAIGRYGVKIASVLALGYLAKTVIGREEAKVIVIGGSTYVLVSAINEFLVPKITGVGSYHRSTSLGSYNRQAGLGMGSYNSSRTLGAGYPQSSTGGTTVVTAKRFNRFAAR